MTEIKNQPKNLQLKNGETWYEWLGSGNKEKIKEFILQFDSFGNNESMLIDMFADRGAYKDSNSSFIASLTCDGERVEESSLKLINGNLYTFNIQAMQNWYL